MPDRQLSLKIIDNDVYISIDGKDNKISSSSKIEGMKIYEALGYQIGDNYSLLELTYDKSTNEYKKLLPIWEMIQQLVDKINVLVVTSEYIEDDNID